MLYTNVAGNLINSQCYISIPHKTLENHSALIIPCGIGMED